MITTIAPPKRDRTSPVDEKEHMKYVRDLLEEAVANELAPSFSYGAYYHSSSHHFWQRQIFVGGHTYEKGSPRVTAESFYDVASLTKTLPTSLLLLRLIDEGVICTETLDEPIQKYLPEFRGRLADLVTVKHILSFAIKLDTELGRGQGAGRIESLVGIGIKGIHARIMASGLAYPPGFFAYHNTTSYIAARLIEKLYGMPYEEAADKFIFKPLGLEGGFLSGKLPLHLVTPTEMDGCMAIHGMTHDEFSRALEIMDGPKSGSAGLFLNGNDGMNILRNFCGFNEERKLFGKLTQRTPARFAPYGLFGQMRTNQLSDPEHIYGLGWDILDREYGDCACGPESTLLITGFTGCVIMIQPTQHRGFFLFSNSTFPHRRPKVGDKSPLYELRRKIYLSLQSCSCDC